MKTNAATNQLYPTCRHLSLIFDLRSAVAASELHVGRETTQYTPLARAHCRWCHDQASTVEASYRQNEPDVLESNGIGLHNEGKSPNFSPYRNSNQRK